MRDLGLEEAIRVAGGVGALAKKLGISQPSVSNWSRVPAERVLSVEEATGVSRVTLRPDLYEHAGTAGHHDQGGAPPAPGQSPPFLLPPPPPSAALPSA